MPRKKDEDRTYGEKLINLFARLLFTGEKHSLIELSNQLNCSKQTIQRLIDDITRAYQAPIEEFFEGKRKYYRIKRQAGCEQIQPLSASELALLQMCQSFTKHLLGNHLYKETAKAILKSQASVSGDNLVSSHKFDDFIPGTIDYTAFHKIIMNLIKAMEKSNVCKIQYKSPEAQKAKTLYIKPLKMFSYKDTIYLHGRLAKHPGQPYREPDFDPLLAVHRINSCKITDREFEFPASYDFESFFNQNFGIMKNSAFRVEAEFMGWAAKFIAERQWSPDQEIVEKNKEKITLKFSAASKDEITSWLLQFGPQARVIQPEWLKTRIKESLDQTLALYDH
jgi:predicted DNA-binding transcriptional regulator YafY